jgi:thiazole biosynthesis enzyme
MPQPQMETRIAAAIIGRYFEKLRDCLTLDVALVGAGPSSLVAARDLARRGFRTAVFESRLAPGGGVWGGGMLFNEVVVQEDVLPILEDFGISVQPAGEGLLTCDAVELAAALILGACRAGARIFNAVKVQDLMVREGRVAGVVVNWSPVARLEMHVDPLVIAARAVVDGSGHPSTAAEMAVRKAGLRLDTPTGGIVGEKPMWMELGESATVENTKRLCPGLYAAGMAANNVQGGYRMGPVFGGMLRSGRKVAELVARDLQA